MIKSACGNDCSLCPRYNKEPYIKSDEQLHQTAILWYRIGYRDHIVSNEEIACDGCKEENWCRYQVVKCAREHHVSNCGLCKEYPCDTILECFKVTMNFEDRCKACCDDQVMNRMHRAFFEKEKNLNMEKVYCYVNLKEVPELLESASKWFHEKWGVPQEAYVECMEQYLSGQTDLGWYLCLKNQQIVGGLGVIENDFHPRVDLTPNICAVYVEESERKQGIAGKLLNLAVEDLRSHGIAPTYLLTDHDSFYERYGWTFLEYVTGDGEEEPSRMYIHE